MYNKWIYRINQKNDQYFLDILSIWLYDKLNKGVSILFNQLPYTLRFVKPYTITSNSKAA